MKKILTMIFLILINIISFSKNIDFNFNIPTGKILYYKDGAENSGEALFYDGHTQLNLEEKNYSFVFSTPEYPMIQKDINIKEVNEPININFTRNDTVKIKGNVKSGELNIGAAKITLYNSKNIGYNFTTDLFGNFTAYVPKGNYRIHVERKDYTLDKKNAIVYQFTNPAIPYTVNINLHQIPSFIKGQAVDEHGNSIPYPIVSIKLGTEIKKITGDEFGMFELKLKPGIVTIMCEKEGYTENGTIRNVEKNTSVTNIEIQLTRIRSSISGIVTDGVKPIRGAKVFLRDNDFNKISTTKTDENGFYEFYKIPSRKNVFITVMDNNKVLKRSESFDLDHDIKNFNLILDN